MGIPALNLTTVSAPTIVGFIPPEVTRLFGCQYSLRVSGSRGSLQRISASFEVVTFIVLLTAPPIPLLPAVGTKPSENSESASQAGTNSSATKTVQQPILHVSISPQAMPAPPPTPTSTTFLPQQVPHHPTLPTPPSIELNKVWAFSLHIMCTFTLSFAPPHCIPDT